MVGIYRLYNKVNGKFYIGSTTNFKRRKNQHLLRFRKGKGNSAIKSAVAKYGPDSFDFEEIEVIERLGRSNLELRAQLEEREQFYIDNLKPHYNIRIIANSNAGLVRSPEHHRRMIEASLKSPRRYRQPSKPIECFKDGQKIGEYNSIKEAAKKLGLTKSSVSRVVSGLMKQTKGLNFKLKDHGSDL